ncbi:MAG: AAA family ATPase [Deltaproteobacteria bacterium]|nr:AAA family ATPase [Deltaproteobacteria bacterium]
MYLRNITIENSRFPVRDTFPFNISAFKVNQRLEIESSIVFFSGDNGVGKSALLDAIARKCGFLPWGGSKIHRAHSNPYETQLANFIKLDFQERPKYGFHFRAEVFFNFASSLDDVLLDDPGRREYFGGASLNAQSHGESFLTFFQSYAFDIDGLYLIDEPESALSPRSQIEFVKTLVRNVKCSNKQYIVATLSPIILACPEAQIFGFDETGIKSLSFRDTGVYNLYKRFIDDPDGAFGAG